MADLEPAATALQDVVDSIRDDQLDASTPCADRSVTQLLGHVVGLTRAFRAAAEKDFGEWTDTNPDGDGWPAAELSWREGLADELPALVAAWNAPDATEGMTRAGGVDLPGEVAQLVVLDELVLHGWDLARATEQGYHVDDATVETLLGFVEGFDPGGTPGLFGPAVTVGPDAPLIDRLVARTGRDPQWTPPG